MVRHIVFFKMKPSEQVRSAEKNAKLLAQTFWEISGKIPQVLSVKTGFNQNNEKQFYELCLNQTFAGMAELEAYLVDPLHLKARELVFAVIDHRIVVDYEF